MNKAIVSGNFGREPEIKRRGDKVTAVFSIASYEGKDADGDALTEWHDCKAFGKTAELIESYGIRGGKVLIEGRIRTESWEDKEGEKRYRKFVYVNTVEFLYKVEKRERDEDEQEEEQPKRRAKKQEAKKAEPAKKSSGTKGKKAKSETDDEDDLLL